MAYRNLPAGVQDLLPRECYILSEVKDRLWKKFKLCGYEPVLSATLEYYDTYSEISNRIAQERMFKLTDTDGKLLVLRPDLTLAISRIAATKLQRSASRLCYFADKWDLQNGGGISSREVYQAGVECLGEEGAFSDAQAIAFAVECVKETGVRNFIVDIGHVGYFKGLLEECGLSEADAETVRSCINAKDGWNAERTLRKAGASEKTVNAVLALPALFGGAEVLEKAQSLTENPRARAAVAHLKEVHAILSRMGYGDVISYDLGTVKRLSYYSGIVFSGLVKELGAPVFSGGRYDHLADDFGKHIPAVGFAIGLKRVLIALERQGNLPPEPILDGIIYCEEGAEGIGYSAFLKMTAEGKRIRFCAEYGVQTDGNEKTERYLATKKGLKKL